MSKRKNYIDNKAKSVVVSESETTRLTEINDFVQSKMRSLLIEDERFRETVIGILTLANSEEFRKKIPLLAYALCQDGEWAYPGGRPKRSSEKKSKIILKKITSKNKKHMHLIKLDVDPFDLILEGWSKVITDIREDDSKKRTIRVSTPYQLVEVFYRKMENHMKTLAQKEANFWLSDASVQPIESVRKSDVKEEYHDGNIIYLGADEIADKQMKYERICSVLMNHPEHRETIRRLVIEDLKPADEAEKYDVTVDEVNRRRDTAMKYLRRKLNPVGGK